jgi:hypothetical protein
MGIRVSLYLTAILCGFAVVPARPAPASPSTPLTPAHVEAAARAIAHRDSLFRAIDLPPPYHIDSLRSNADLLVYSNYDSLRAREPVWGPFLSGLVPIFTSTDTGTPAQTNEVSRAAFRESIEAARSDAGALFLLLHYLHQLELPALQDSCLQSLQGHMCARGAQRYRLIAGSLLHFSVQDAAGDAHRTHLSHARTFDAYEPWIPYMQAAASLFSTPGQAVSALQEGFSLLHTSWWNQLQALHTLVQGAMIACALFIALVMAGCAYRGLPPALHGLTHHIPWGKSPRVNLTLVILIYLSLVTFGLFFFTIVTVCIIWRYLSRQEKTAAGIVAILALGMILLSTSVGTMEKSTHPGSSLYLFEQSRRREANRSLYHHLRQYVITHNRDHLAHTAAAIQALKLAQLQQARHFISQALSLRPDDPVVIAEAVNVHDAAGSRARADSLYARLQRRFPGYTHLYLPPGTIDSLHMHYPDSLQDTAPGMHGPAGRFVRENRRFFTDTLPRARRHMHPDYTPAHFWRHVFDATPGVWKHSDVIWRRLWLGTSIGGSLILTLLGCSAAAIAAWRRIIRPVMFCRTCGIPICDDCAQEKHLCARCFSYAGDVDDDQMAEYIEDKIRKKHTRLFTILPWIVNALLPGLRVWFDVRVQRTAVLLWGCACTAVVYAGYIMLAVFRFSYPLPGALRVLYICLVPLCLYSLFFFVRSLIHALQLLLEKRQWH